MKATAPDVVATALQREVDTAQQLVVILQQESQALVTNQVDAIERTTQAKSQLATALSTHRRDRLEALRLVGLDATDANMALWVEQQADPMVVKNWQTLLDLIAEVQQTNRNNGLVLQTLLVQNQAALSALRVHKKSDVYGPNGYKTTASSFRSILA